MQNEECGDGSGAPVFSILHSHSEFPNSVSRSSETNNVIQCLWIGPRLSAMEQTSIASFLRHGHEVHLYTYGGVDGVPLGTIIRDGREILPAERIFRYREHDSVSGFSNFFRYKLLLERGGWWVDTDLVCVKPFAFDGDYVFASEMSRGAAVVTSSAIKAPRSSEAIAFAWEVCNAKDPATLRWGETGPALTQQLVERFGLHDAVQPPHVFCPIPFWEWRRLIDADAPDLPEDAVAVHLWKLCAPTGRGRGAQRAPSCVTADAAGRRALRPARRRAAAACLLSDSLLGVAAADRCRRARSA